MQNDDITTTKQTWQTYVYNSCDNMARRTQIDGSLVLETIAKN